MQRFVGVMILLSSPAVFAADDVTPFWHFSAHGDSILLVLFGVWLVRRQCLLALYPKPVKIPPKPYRRRRARLLGHPFKPTAWPAYVAALQMRIRTTVVGLLR